MTKSLFLIMLLMFGALSSQAEDLGMWSLDYVSVYDLADRIAEDFIKEFQIRDLGIQSVISAEAGIEPYQDAVTIAGINIKMYAKGVMEATAKLAFDYRG